LIGESNFNICQFRAFWLEIIYLIIDWCEFIIQNNLFWIYFLKAFYFLTKIYKSNNTTWMLHLIHSFIYSSNWSYNSVLRFLTAYHLDFLSLNLALCFYCFFKNRKKFIIPQHWIQFLQVYVTFFNCLFIFFISLAHILCIKGFCIQKDGLFFIFAF
jgi:hypothetical protein